MDDEHKAEPDPIEASEGPPEEHDVAEEATLGSSTAPVDETDQPAGDESPRGPTRRERWAESTSLFRERLAATLAPARERIGGRLGGVWAWLSRGNWVYGLIAALVIVALLLPPISLPQRLGLVGFTRLNAEHPSTSHPDGITVAIDPEDAVSIRLALNSVPQLDFLEGAAGSALRTAAEALPEWMQVKSPYYEIRVASRTSGPATIEVTIPNEAEPWETLDLYTWTGTAWEWLGATLDAEREVLVAEVDRLPSSVVVAQTAPIVPAVGTITEEDLPGMAAEVVSEVLIPGLYLGTDGALLGQPPEAAGTEGEPQVVPLIRNWQEDGGISTALLADLLSDQEIQQAHIASIVAYVGTSGATAVAIDYRGVSTEQGEAFSVFVEALATALHEQNAWLEVLVPPATHGSSGWETGGYDWPALGASADALLIPFPDAPDAYAAGGEVESLLNWAVGQVDRYHLRALVSSLSTDLGDDELRYVGLEEALAPLGEVTPGSETIEPGDEVAFALVGQWTSIVRDETAGTYAIAYQTEDESSRTVWLGTPYLLALRLDWALRYHLGGALIADLAAEGNLPGMPQAVAGYRTGANLPEPTELQVVWTVQSDEATEELAVLLNQPELTWTFAEAGTYTVTAAISDVVYSSIQVVVEEPEVAEEPTGGGASRAVLETGCLQAAFVADVTVPDGTQFEPDEEFIKTWELRNSGSCDWPEDTVLAFVSGSQMGAPDSVPVGPVAMGDTVAISVEMTAPATDGRYSGTWALQVGDGAIPGGSVTVQIQIGEGGGEATPAPPSPVAPGSFELGGHVRDTSLPFAELMRYAGMNWTKIQVHYPQDASSLIATAHSRGFRIQLSALGSPTMVTQAGFEQAFANWVAGLAAAGADAIEIWNEPNIDREWQNGFIDPAAYTRLLCASFNAIRAANPDTMVISAAPAPTGYYGGCHGGGCDDLPFLQGMYNAGAAACMDYIGAHHNAGATSPSASTGHPADSGGGHHSWYFLPQTRLYYNTFGGTRQLFYTEMGYASQEGVPTFSDAFAWARGTNNAQQAAWLSEAVQLSINTGMVRCIIVWNIDFPRYGDDPQDGFAIRRPGGSCPACDSLHGLLGTR